MFNNVLVNYCARYPPKKKKYGMHTLLALSSSSKSNWMKIAELSWVSGMIGTILLWFFWNWVINAKRPNGYKWASNKHRRSAKFNKHLIRFINSSHTDHRTPNLSTGILDLNCYLIIRSMCFFSLLLSPKQNGRFKRRTNHRLSITDSRHDCTLIALVNIE